MKAECAPGKDYISSSSEVHTLMDQSLEQVMKPTPLISEISRIISLWAASTLLRCLPSRHDHAAKALSCDPLTIQSVSSLQKTATACLWLTYSAIGFLEVRFQTIPLPSHDPDTMCSLSMKSREQTGLLCSISRRGLPEQSSPQILPSPHPTSILTSPAWRLFILTLRMFFSKTLTVVIYYIVSALTECSLSVLSELPVTSSPAQQSRERRSRLCDFLFMLSSQVIAKIFQILQGLYKSDLNQNHEALPRITSMYSSALTPYSIAVKDLQQTSLESSLLISISNINEESSATLELELLLILELPPSPIWLLLGFLECELMMPSWNDCRMPFRGVSSYSDFLLENLAAKFLSQLPYSPAKSSAISPLSMRGILLCMQAQAIFLRCIFSARCFRNSARQS